jgi:hypothetical protein
MSTARDHAMPRSCLLSRSEVGKHSRTFQDEASANPPELSASYEASLDDLGRWGTKILVAGDPFK